MSGPQPASTVIPSLVMASHQLYQVGSVLPSSNARASNCRYSSGSEAPTTNDSPHSAKPIDPEAPPAPPTLAAELGSVTVKRSTWPTSAPQVSPPSEF